MKNEEERRRKKKEEERRRRRWSGVREKPFLPFLSSFPSLSFLSFPFLVLHLTRKQWISSLLLPRRMRSPRRW